MRLQIQRHCAREPVFLAQDQKLRRPAGFCAGTARLVERMQEFMREQGIVAGKPIPFRCRYGRQRVTNFDYCFCLFQLKIGGAGNERLPDDILECLRQ